MAKKKQWKYYASSEITHPDDTIEKYQSQLYQTGVYVIFNDNSTQQASFSPAKMQKMCKQMQKDVENGTLKAVKWGREIVVEEVNGLYVEVQ